MNTLLSLSLLLCSTVSGEYQIGLGIADVTGPIAEIGFMGYGKLDQKGNGLHLRQWARSYIIDDGESRVVFVNVDVGMMGDSLRLEVLSNLEKMFGSLYHKDNVMISGTHTHSAPGGFLSHLLFDLPILGFSYETFGALVSGIVKGSVVKWLIPYEKSVFFVPFYLKSANAPENKTVNFETRKTLSLPVVNDDLVSMDEEKQFAVVKTKIFMKIPYHSSVSFHSGTTTSIVTAHGNVQPGKIYLGVGQLNDASINRSPTAYLENPAEERSRYETNVDTEMVQLKFRTPDGRPLGVINWFPVHPTSMNNTNTLVSSDNVGFASIKFEERMNPNTILGNGPFIASFASSNLGDVSPNIRGPKCQLSGKSCDMVRSTCEEKRERCVASGPGRDIFESTAIIAERIFQKGLEIWNSEDEEEITGPIGSLHQYKDMSTAEETVIDGNGRELKIKGCYPAMGYSFAAGTTDGPGAFGFQQGTLTENPLWNIVRDFLSSPTQEDIMCHSPKPILLATGRMVVPYEWQPRVVSTQVALIGNVLLACLPGEFTTMAGRRMRSMLSQLLEDGGVSPKKVILAGLCNTYSDYITTFEEYQAQRYEGASTIYGPRTLDLHMAQYRRLTEAVMKGERMTGGPNPTGFSRNLLSLITPVIYDTPELGYKFGDVIRQPPGQARVGDVIIVRFISGHPRNNLKHGETYCTVERRETDDVWNVVATDANWETKVRWIRRSKLLGTSHVEVEWTIPETVTTGIYRIRHFGDYKFVFGGIFPYSGTTQSFQVLGNGP